MQLSFKVIIIKLFEVYLLYCNNQLILEQYFPIYNSGKEHQDLPLKFSRRRTEKQSR
jgi:hypothetical protein